MVDFVGKRYWYFLISALMVVPGLILLVLYGLPLSMDFAGGALLELQFSEARDVRPAVVKDIFAAHGYAEVTVQTSGEDTVLVRSKHMDLAAKDSIEVEAGERLGSFTELRFESLGPTVAGEVVWRGVVAVAVAAVVALLYVSWAFRRLPSPLRYGTCVVASMLHDVAVVIGLTAILGRVLGWEVNVPFLLALLTVIGFSIHDTIVVFSRIRENMTRHRGEHLAGVVNHSIIQTLSRSINVRLGMTFSLVAVALFGGVTIKRFALIILIGIMSSTYSSLFIASQLLMVWETGEVGKSWDRVRRRLLRLVSA